jgi:phenylacetate-CoA ligase
MAFEFVRRLYGSAVVLWNAMGQSKVPYWPEERLIEERDRRVREIVAYAATTVPYYQEMLRREGIDPGDIRTAEDLERLPLIDRDWVRRDPERFRSTSKAGQAAIASHTSGTTRTPITIYEDCHSMLVNSAYNVRERPVIQKLLGVRRVPRAAYIEYPASTLGDLRAALDRARYRPRRGSALRLPMSEPIANVVARINEYQPDILASCGTYLEALFRTVAARGLRLHTPRLLIYGADAMTESGKRLIREEFGVPIYSTYQSVEMPKIGFTCEAQGHFHLHVDLTHVRIINRNGRTLPSGQSGEVVASNLFNHGTVLLNYRHGDIATLHEERCSCGRTLPLLSGLDGRMEDLIWRANGDFIHPFYVLDVVLRQREVIQYQLIQHAVDSFELKLVAADRDAFDGLVGGVLDGLRALLGPTARIEAQYYERLEPPKQGKFRAVVTHVESPLGAV